MEIFEKAMIAAAMASQRKMISMKAPPGECRPKKMIDQSVLSASWTRKMPRAIFTSPRSRPFFQIKNAATPMSAYRVVQTGPKIQFGGENSDLARLAYHPCIAGAVNTEPMMPASSETPMAITSLKRLLIFIIIKIFSFLSKIFNFTIHKRIANL